MKYLVVLRKLAFVPIFLVGVVLGSRYGSMDIVPAAQASQLTEQSSLRQFDLINRNLDRIARALEKKCQ